MSHFWQRILRNTGASYRYTLRTKLEYTVYYLTAFPQYKHPLKRARQLVNISTPLRKKTGTSTVLQKVITTDHEMGITI